MAVWQGLDYSRCSGRIPRNKVRPILGEGNLSRKVGTGIKTVALLPLAALLSASYGRKCFGSFLFLQAVAALPARRLLLFSIASLDLLPETCFLAGEGQQGFEILESLRVCLAVAQDFFVERTI